MFYALIMGIIFTNDLHDGQERLSGKITQNIEALLSLAVLFRCMIEPHFTENTSIKVLPY